MLEFENMLLQIFINFLAKFDVENLYIQNPPLQISEQILRLYPKCRREISKDING